MKPSIQFSAVSKQYRIGQSVLSLKSLISGMGKAHKEKYHWAVRDVDFELYPGEALGVIGPNGAGKTTILKLLSKVTNPTSGKIHVNGRLSALIELGAGFHPELTGRENVYLNGAILGMKRADIKQRFDQIVEFSEIKEYLDTPVKRYSSGMYARLGFSVAAHVDPEILLVDEVLAVGDMAFQRKCYDHMRQLLQKGTTLLFVSHNLRAVQSICERCLVMYRGKNVFDGPAGEATAEYSNILRNSAAEVMKLEGRVDSGLSQRIMTHAAEIIEVKMVHPNGLEAFTFNSEEKIGVQVKVKFNQSAPSPIFACTIRQADGQIVYDFTTGWAEMETPNFEAGAIATIEFPMILHLAAGTYHLGVDLAYQDLSRYYDRLERALDFVITGGNGARGVANLEAGFRVVKIEAANSHTVYRESKP